jgi:PAS domain-containing protein
MDGDNFGDGRHQERRRHRPAGQSPMDILRQLPALVVLQRMPVPVLAVGDDGTILFANAAFGQMLGHPAEAVLSLRFAQIFAGQAADTSPVMFIRARTPACRAGAPRRFHRASHDEPRSPAACW